MPEAVTQLLGEYGKYASIIAGVLVFLALALLRNKLASLLLGLAMGWGGLSVHCQTMAVLEGLSPARHWVGKALHCLLAAALTLAALAVGML